MAERLGWLQNAPVRCSKRTWPSVGRLIRESAASPAHSKAVTQVPLLDRRRFILGGMIFLSAFARLTAAPDAPANDLLAKAHAALGHLGLTVIAVIFILLNFWRG